MAKAYDENLILGYVEGDLEPGDRAKVEAQLAADPKLAALVAGMTQDCVALRAMPREAPPADLVDDVLARVERGMLLGDAVQPLGVEQPAARTFRLSRVLAYSGLAALVAISGGLLTFSIMTGGLLQTTQEHAVVGSFFERGGRSADAREARDRTPPRPEPAAPAAAEAPTGLAAATASEAQDVGSEPAAAKPQAIPDMARSVEQLALDSIGPRPTPRLRRYTKPLVVRAERATLRIDGQSGEVTSSVTPIRVKVLTRDSKRAERDLEQWATFNLAQVVQDDEPAAGYSANATGMDASEFAGGDTAGRVVIVRLDRARVPDLVQYLNRDGQEAGLVPIQALVCRNDGSKPQPLGPDEANLLIARQFVASNSLDPQEDAARALTQRLERLQRSVRERGHRGGPTAPTAMAMQGTTVGPESLPFPSASLALAEPVSSDADDLSDHDWNQFFPYDLPFPVAPGRGMGTGGGSVTVPVIISETRP